MPRFMPTKHEWIIILVAAITASITAAVTVECAR